MSDNIIPAKLQTLIGLGGLNSLSVLKHQLIVAGQVSGKVVKIDSKRPIFAGLEDSPHFIKISVNYKQWHTTPVNTITGVTVVRE